jgi:hypothetical protein
MIVYWVRQMVMAMLITTTAIITLDIANALTLQEKSDAILAACLAAGKQQKIEGKIGIDGGITLTGPALKGKGDIALSREEWSGLIGGISRDMTQLQAEQADKVRECMAPAREVLLKKILESE